MLSPLYQKDNFMFKKIYNYLFKEKVKSKAKIWSEIQENVETGVDYVLRNKNSVLYIY